MNLRTCLYLDDTRTPTKSPEGYGPWNVVRSYDEFVEWILTNGIPDYISFDHDLSDEHMRDYYNYQAQGIPAINYEDFKEKTGLDCARWLCEYVETNGLQLPRLMGVHSHNPIGAHNIQSLVNGFKKHMGWTQDCFLGKPEFIIEKKAA